MKNWTRRRFLQTTAAGTAVATVGLGSPGLFGRVLEADEGRSSDRTGTILVLLELAGGNDGLNTIVPYTDDRYHRARPVLGIGPGEVLALDDRFGLHPAMDSLRRVHDDGRLAIVHGVGYPGPNRSHFESMDIWHSARTDADLARTSTGWLGRYLDLAPYARRAELPALAVGGRLPRVLRAARTAVPAVGRPDDFGLGDDPGSPLDRQVRRRALEDLLKREGDPEGDTLDFLRQAARDAVLTSERLQEIAGTFRTGVEFPASPVGQALRFVAQMLAADLGSRIYHVSMGGFDTHAGQDVRHPRLLGDLADAIEAWTDEVRGQGRTEQVCLVSYSEFGRRVSENASAGTDHGAAGPVLLVGGRIRPGFHGRFPDLGDLADGDPKYTTDFRDLYATILADWLGADPGPVLGAAVGRVEGLFA